MSRTYRAKRVRFNSWFSIYSFEEWAEWKKIPVKKAKILPKMDGQARGWFMTTPSWYNRDYHTKPRRAKTRKAIQQVYKLADYEDVPEFPLDKKPHIYYW